MKKNPTVITYIEYVCSLSCSTYELAINITTTKPKTKQTQYNSLRMRAKTKRAEMCLFFPGQKVTVQVTGNSYE